MALWEVPWLVRGLSYQGLYLREGQRLTAWAALAPWSKPYITPTDLVRYPWDAESDTEAWEDDQEELTEEVRKRMSRATALLRYAHSSTTQRAKDDGTE